MITIRKRNWSEEVEQIGENLTEKDLQKFVLILWNSIQRNDDHRNGEWKSSAFFFREVSQLNQSVEKLQEKHVKKFGGVDGDWRGVNSGSLV